MSLFAIPAVSIALSLVICWALFAIVCSLVHECVTSIKAERGRFMQRYLLAQLQDDPNGINWADRLYQHGNISLLSRDVRKPSNDISPDLFAKTMVDVVSGSDLVRTEVQHLQDTAAGESPRNAAVAREALTTLGSYTHPQLYYFKAAVSLLKQSEQVTLFASCLRNAELNSASSSAPNEQEVYQHLQDNLKKWFVELSERLTLWYKKKTRQRIFWLGLVLALVLNVDSLDLFNLFNRNPTARDTVISYYKDNQAYLEGLAARLDSSHAKLPIDSLRNIAGVYGGKLDSLQKAAALPIGIRYSVFYGLPAHPKKFLLFKLIGILISGLAASMGAPFWFDLLRKAISFNRK